MDFQMKNIPNRLCPSFGEKKKQNKNNSKFETPSTLRSKGKNMDLNQQRNNS